ncbi:MAG: diguanylate cyclase [Xanthobacteraceae bacterium]
MTGLNFRHYLTKFKTIFDVRARLVVVALVLVVPLMLDRARVLENMRTEQIQAGSARLASVARRGADEQRQMMKTVEGVLRTSASIFRHFYKVGSPCGLLQSGFKVNLPAIGNISVVGNNGRVLCSTLPRLVGIDITDRGYFHDALAQRRFVLSDYVIAKGDGTPSVIAALPTTAQGGEGVEAVMVTSVALTWLEDIINRSPDTTGITIQLIDGKGAVLAARPMVDIAESPIDRAVIARAVAATSDEVSDTVKLEGSAQERVFASIRVPDTNARLIASIDKRELLGSIDRDIRAAYIQLGLVGLLVLLGAWFMSERLIIRPIRFLTGVATRFSAGDFSARSARMSLPQEFVPLAQAFNAMAKTLAERERELLDLNSQLAVLASVDTLSGLANRRAFDGRLDFEWMKATHENATLSLAMIDVDHFKLYNDSYGHLEGDSCLTKVGEVLAAVAAEVKGFGARYGGEEFALMLPAADAKRMTEVAELVRSRIESLGLAHVASPSGQVTVSIGVAATLPVTGQNASDLIEAADAGLYMAKRRGRNTVVEHSAIRLVDQVTALAG